MNREQQYILDCAQAMVRGKSINTVSQAASLNAKRVVGLASEHRIPLDPDTLPRLRNNLLLSQELLNVLDFFEAANIRALPFKGPALASYLYGDPAMRDSCDIDILVRPEQIVRAQELLLAAGYATDLPDDRRRRAAYIRSRYELHFTSPGRPISIEIHQLFLAGSYCLPLDYEGMWRRAERLSFFGREILSLSAGDLLLMLCVHGVKHSWKELVHACDIARLLSTRGDELRWTDILARSRSQGSLRILHVGLLLASKLLGAPLPAHVLEHAAEDSSAIRLRDEACNSLFATNRSRSAFTSYLLFLRSRERLRDRLASIASSTWSPNEEDYSLLPLPSALSPLYVPLHAMRMAGKYGLATLRDGLGF